ncbi:uncharacterized protein RAG0_13640 [Rhynchosporium agropyri]|uniref:Uncharacterized protein n=1 Tax=Rhynchosporium agropyri TaxID=914238 RepID=A0A1E1LDP9_9HELO|nr:uncharacterized protein RAG0_13640 [Rhynchosporium agropyri]
MARTEMNHPSTPKSHQLPATPPCSPYLSSPEHSGLSSQAESLSLFLSEQALTTDDLDRLHSDLINVQLLVLEKKARDGEAGAHDLADREIHTSGDGTPIRNLPLFHEDGWETILIFIFQDSDSDLSYDASSDGIFSDTSPGEAASETSSDGDSSEAGE